MPRPPARLYLDEDVSVVVAAILQARGFDIVTARDTGQLGWSDHRQLGFGAEHRRDLLTHNRADFERLYRRPPGEIATRVGRLLSRLSADDLESQLLFA